MDTKLQQEIRSISGNKKCVDCLVNNPQWASVTMGTLMCLECSGKHRGLGVHISFVRSVQMDSWSPKQIQTMRIGGNDKFRKYLSANNVSNDGEIREKYNTPTVELYALRIRAERDGKKIPTTLPMKKSSGQSSSRGSSGSSSSGSSSSGSSGGSETPQERELRLRREAEERLRKKFGGTNLRGQGVSSSGQTSFGGDEERRNSGRSGMDDVGKHVGNAANVAGQALGQAFDWIGATAKSTVEVVKEKDIGTSVSQSWNKVSEKVTSGEVTASISSGWSSFMSSASGLLRQVSGSEEDIGGQQQGGQQGGQQQQVGRGSMDSSGGRPAEEEEEEDDDAWLQQQLAQAKNRLSQQEPSRGSSSRSASLNNDKDDWGSSGGAANQSASSSNGGGDDGDDGGGWGNDDEDLELFLNSDDDDEKDGGGQEGAPTSVLDMASMSRGDNRKQPAGLKLGSGGSGGSNKSGGNAKTASTGTKLKAKKTTVKKEEEEDFFGSFGF